MELLYCVKSSLFLQFTKSIQSANNKVCTFFTEIEDKTLVASDFVVNHVTRLSRLLASEMSQHALILSSDVAISGGKSLVRLLARINNIKLFEHCTNSVNGCDNGVAEFTLLVKPLWITTFYFFVSFFKIKFTTKVL